MEVFELIDMLSHVDPHAEARAMSYYKDRRGEFTITGVIYDHKTIVLTDEDLD